MPFESAIFWTFIGLIFGFIIACSIFSILLQAGKIDTVLKFLDVKRRYAEVIPVKQPDPNPNLYYKQPPDKKTPNK